MSLQERIIEQYERQLEGEWTRSGRRRRDIKSQLEFEARAAGLPISQLLPVPLDDYIGELYT